MMKSIIISLIEILSMAAALSPLFIVLALTW